MKTKTSFLPEEEKTAVAKRTGDAATQAPMVPEQSQRLQRVAKVVRGEAPAEVDKAVRDRIVSALETMADAVTVELINTCLYGENAKVRLAAIKEYFKLIGIDSVAVQRALAKARDAISAEEIMAEYVRSRKPIGSSPDGEKPPSITQ